MKTIIGLILLLGGIAIMVGGFGWAVWEFAQLYSATLSDGMNSTADSKKTSSAMFTAAVIGLVGFVPMTVGSFMLGRGLFARITRRLRGDEASPRRGR